MTSNDHTVPGPAPQPGQDAPDAPMLDAPELDDALPAPAPMGQESTEQVHQTEEAHQPVEGAPGLETPADTLPQQENPPSVFPPTAGPDQPHQF